ncbi:MAG: ribonuclease III [Betaproteobacteria bacterium]|nr:ribonuclease III [Betaproteobacteria bacterium]
MSPATLRDRIGYAFQEPALLAQALTHRSHGAAHNERLEFVGDAVLNCVVAAALYRRLRDLPEGDLSRLRANLVNRDTLAQLARQIGLGALLRVGEGERRGGGGERPSIVADALEAVFGAVFLDGGYDAARAAIERVYGDLLAEADPEILGKDPKTRLQEWLQARRLAVPEYVVAAVTGVAHAQTFAVHCRIPALGIETAGTGSSRRIAEQAAAELAHARLAGADGGSADV